MEIGDRLDEAWETLQAIAAHAGGGWLKRARVAAVALAGRTEDDGQDDRLVLLRALREMFGDKRALSSEEICRKLNADDELPFGSKRGGRGVDARGLATLLRPYKIKSRPVRLGADVAKGYHRDQFAEVWGRYLGGEGARTTDPADEGLQGLHPSAHGTGDVTHVTDVTPKVQPPPRASISTNGDGPTQTVADLSDAELLEVFPGAEVERDEPPVERDVKAAEAAKLLDIHPQTLEGMLRRGAITPSTDAGPSKRWYPMAELRRIKPDVGPPPKLDLLTRRERDRAEHYRGLWPWPVREVAAPSQLRRCRNCGYRDFWRLRAGGRLHHGGNWTCTTCHPPARSEEIERAEAADA